MSKAADEFSIEQAQILEHCWKATQHQDDPCRRPHSSERLELSMNYSEDVALLRRRLVSRQKQS